jgi:hypothetical protein
MDMWNISFKQYKYTEKKTNDIPLTHYVFIQRSRQMTYLYLTMFLYREVDKW